MKTTITIVASALALAAAAPAAAQNREHLQMAAELRMLQEQQVQLSLKIDQLTQALTDALKALDGRIDQSNETMRTGLADQGVALTNLGGELRVIRENTQNTATRLGQLNEELVALRGTVTSMLSRMTAAPPLPVDPLDPNAPPPVAAQPALPPPPSAAGLSPTQVFDTARSDYGAGQFDLAISGFEQFIRLFPDSERVDDAQQYIGDAELNQNRFEQAIAAYNRVIQNHPNGDQIAWAYYKRGLVLRRLKRADEARASLEMAIKLGDVEVAGLAKQQLDGLLQEAGAPPARQ